MSSQIQRQKNELLQAAKEGIEKYLSSTRGANLFGADAKVERTSQTEFEVRFTDAAFRTAIKVTLS